MTEAVDVALAGRRLWLADRGDRMGLAAMVPDPHRDFSDDHLDASYDADSRAPRHLDSRKRKEVSAGGSDLMATFDQHKRNKQAAHPQYSVASSRHDSTRVSTSMAEAHRVPDPLLMMQANYIVSSRPSRRAFKDRGASAAELGVAEDTSGWSTDNDNARDDEFSGGHLSAFASSEECHSPSPHDYCDPFLRADREVSAFDQPERQRNSSGIGGGSTSLRAQLGQFIHKEKEKGDSSVPDGGSFSGGSQHSLSGSLQAYKSLQHPTRILDERLSGSSASMSSLLGEVQATSILSLHAEEEKTAQHGGLGFRPATEARIPASTIQPQSQSEEEERIVLTQTIRGLRCSPFPAARMDLTEEVLKLRRNELHQKFVLSSGRLSHIEAAHMGKRTSTIDRDFDDYFADLML